MVKTKNHYIKYKLAELESYTRNPESCVKKINCTERLRFAPNIVGNLKESILRILSRKIGKYDIKMQGVVLDFRNTKILNILNDIRNDSAYSIINLNSNFYIFAPKKDAIVDGIIKHVNFQNIETIITVVIFRVFNVKVIFKGCIKKSQVRENDVIKIRIKKFHFDNEIPYIEGEMLSSCSNNYVAFNTRKIFEDDSGVSESSLTFELNPLLNIKKEQEDMFDNMSTCPTQSKALKRKRMKSPENIEEAFISKKIKQEPIDFEDTTDTQEFILNIKQEIQNCENKSNKDEINIKNKSVQDANDKLKESSSKKKKEKKKKYRKVEDEFETSLQLLFNSSSIKTEKN
ncbi:hypothetical protein PVAND_011614 [Polypedilum vanderplanki]|uniref:DNA-directed RNA polymerase I subunit RPA43 n=1 Tax=Polypedilum vanderplanki TaxID=319348 RepID=A0A9J6CJ49_POLVA|nr:hypothetical protein PVAND_011614 [Polypedilum vanderplanki]